MATTKPISGNVQRNNGGTVINAGNLGSNGVITRNLTLLEDVQTEKGGLYQAVSPVDSGNLGTLKAKTGNPFDYQHDGYIVVGHTSTVGGAAQTALQGGASDFNVGKQGLHFSNGNNRYDISSWDYVTGAATKGGNAGDSVTFYDPENKTSIAREPYPTNAVPGEFTTMVTGLTPTKNDYPARQN